MPRTIRPIRPIPLLSERDRARFWAKVALPDGNGCMLWLSSLSRRGYARFLVAGAKWPGRRVAWVLAYGPMPSEFIIRSTCGVQRCVALSHLRVKEFYVSDTAERILLPREVAAMFGVNVQTLARWAREGKVPHSVTASGHRRYRESEINALLGRGEA